LCRAECLRKIDHPDLLTAVKFHPLSERYCVTGCFDGIVRIWDLLKDENQEVAWNDVSEGSYHIKVIYS
jgi:WD40 repeat protein